MTSLSIDQGFLEFLNKQKKEYREPIYIFSICKIRERLSYLRQKADENNIQIIMATKSFDHPEIYKLCAEKLHGFDVSNFWEWNSVKHIASAETISVTGPNYNVKDILNWGLPEEAQINVRYSRKLWI